MRNAFLIAAVLPLALPLASSALSPRPLSMWSPFRSKSFPLASMPSRPARPKRTRNAAASCARRKRSAGAGAPRRRALPQGKPLPTDTCAQSRRADEKVQMDGRSARVTVANALLPRHRI